MINTYAKLMIFRKNCDQVVMLMTPSKKKKSNAQIMKILFVLKCSQNATLLVSKVSLHYHLYFTSIINFSLYSTSFHGFISQKYPMVNCFKTGQGQILVHRNLPSQNKTFEIAVRNHPKEGTSICNIGKFK